MSALRVANCSGFYGDRLSAMREVLDGSGCGGVPVDVITGDYLAELTMLILGRDRLRDGSLGYAKTFVRQLEDCLGDALERGVKIVANAGGLNPAGLAARVSEVARGLGLAPVVGYVAGDDLMGRGEESLGAVLDGALTANAYLGAFGIADALTRGADVVVTGRVTDASVVVGPAIAAHGWDPSSLDELAGAVVAGHVIECGTQATGGNFSGFLSMPPSARAKPLGFPIAEIAADGSSVITKHDGTGGVVTVDTVTAQLLYEIQSTVYLNPDVSVDLDSVRLSAAEGGPDRVRISGVRGSAPPERLKVCVNSLGGFRKQMEMVLTGLDVQDKEDWVRAQVEAALDPRPSVVAWSRGRAPAEDPGSEEDAARSLRLSVLDPDADVVGRSFSNAVVALVLGSYPGFHVTSPPGSGSPYGVYRAAYVDRALVEHVSVVGDERVVIADPKVVSTSSSPSGSSGSTNGGPGDLPPLSPLLETTRLPLGRLVQARSGDKGGDANVGLWIGQDAGEKRAARVEWLLGFVTPDRIRELLPEAADLEVEVHPLPHLGGVNVLLRGLLGEGVAASTRFDPQAKAVGEWIRARYVDVPEELL